MIVGENTCDGKKKAYETFSGMVDNLYVMDLPQVKSTQGRALLKEEYERFKTAVEKLTGKKSQWNLLKRESRSSMPSGPQCIDWQHYERLIPHPSQGLDALLANQVFFYDNPARFTESVNKICDELEGRIKENQGAFPANTPRILISGCPMAVPNWKLPWIIESSGAVIVGEEACVGERGTRNLIDDSGQTMDELIDALQTGISKVDCAIFTPNQDAAIISLKWPKPMVQTG